MGGWGAGMGWGGRGMSDFGEPIADLRSVTSIEAMRFCAMSLYGGLVGRRRSSPLPPPPHLKAAAIRRINSRIYVCSDERNPTGPDCKKADCSSGARGVYCVSARGGLPKFGGCIGGASRPCLESAIDWEYGRACDFTASGKYGGAARIAHAFRPAARPVEFARTRRDVGY